MLEVSVPMRVCELTEGGIIVCGKPLDAIVHARHGEYELYFPMDRNCAPHVGDDIRVSIHWPLEDR